MKLRKIIRKCRERYNIGKQVCNDAYYQKVKKASRNESKKQPTRTQIINYLLSQKDGDSSYLEIGVRNPSDNFDHIVADHKYSVDPGVEYETNPVDFKVTSDEFYKLLERGEILSSDVKFDVIFIDGLHLANQVNRDIINSLEYLNDKGFIVLHDCNPPSEVHAREAYTYYNSPAGGDWNGTTWKAFLKWRCSSAVYSCCVDTDWGVGILSKDRNIGNSIKPSNPFYEFDDLDENRKRYLNLIGFNELKASVEST